ncbi:tyrosyl-DNA phosphodiesterase domain-containing protein [Metarhizium rileyi]|uniref:Tyrosyl-DNA phosphodiesterase domain-containing protein n=1 Tax=Metarhizium rileyi (strain RCEF 4871) TaxID=1649241 RepID=A0A166Z2C1_METRR|nr:tyrosyl-DNA phosphodiesterase domain-containing protein [Metarhizium rileyi RCEF 4871]
MASTDESENEQLERAIALSLQDHAERTVENVLQHSEPPPNKFASFGLGSLDRKKMEDERLARVAAKRPRVVHDEGYAAEMPASKRMALQKVTQAAEKIAVPFPKGTVKRTWVRGFDRSADDIKIEEVLQRDKLLLALFSSYQWDETWLLSKVDISCTKVLLVAFASDEAQEMRQNAPSNFKFCFPYMRGPGSMHSKLQILRFSSYLRIVIPSGNLVPNDWGETGVMENMVFLIDLPLKDYYLRAMGVDTGMVNSLSKYDFSRTEDIGFVYSMPGSHESNFLCQNGYHGLATTISALGLATGSSVEVDIACASLGSIKYDFVHAIYRACQGHTDIEKLEESKHPGSSLSQRSGQSEHQDSFRIYFPTHETVARSRGGENAAGTICFQEKWWHMSSFPTELMRDCVNNRDGLLMHTKLILVRHRTSSEAGTSKKVAWAYLGSANLSESAWGRVVTDRTTGKKKLMCRNWECGVVLPVRVSEQGNGPVDMKVFQGTVPIPMQVPGRKYLQNEHPWFFHRHVQST